MKLIWFRTGSFCNTPLALPQHRGTQICPHHPHPPKYYEHLKILGGGKLWWNKFHPGDSHLLGYTVQMLFATETWRPGFSHPSLHVSVIYEACPKIIQPFWISREPFAWPWFNLPASQRRPYCASVNSHSPVGLVSWQRDAVNWVCVLCDRRIHNARESRSASSRQCACPCYNSRAGVFGKTSPHPGLSSFPTTKIWLPATSRFSQS